MTFIFAGQKIPIHPLDTSIDLNVTDDSGNKVCLGSVSTGGPSFGLTMAYRYIVSTYHHRDR